MFFEVYLRNHHAVAAATEVSAIAELFCEEVAGVDDARYVFDLRQAKLMCFSHIILFEIHVFSAFVGDGSGPLDAGVVVVVDRDTIVGVGHHEIEGPVANVFELGHAFGGGDDLSFAGAEGRTILTNGFPADRTTSTANDVARDATEFEEFEGGTIGNGVAELSTPACVRERCESFHVAW